MQFDIVLGEPYVADHWNKLESKYDSGKLEGKELIQFKKLIKIFKLLSANPKHPGLSSHKIAELSAKYGFEIWQSYLENKTPSAGRIFWTYGSDKAQITILAIEPHPEMKSKSYTRVKLSNIKPRSK